MGEKKVLSSLKKGLGVKGVKKEEIKVVPKSMELASTEALAAELERETYRQNYRDNLSSTAKTMIVVCSIVIIIATFVFPVMRIFGTSMNPTLEQGEIVVSINKRVLETGDVIGVHYGNSILVKRCIATAGQWVDIDSQGNVYVDDVQIDEPYLTDKALGECDINLPYQVPEKTVFVMGDHRQSSIDSRSMAIGCISLNDVVGRIVFCIWPLKVFGRIA